MHASVTFNLPKECVSSTLGARACRATRSHSGSTARPRSIEVARTSPHCLQARIGEQPPCHSLARPLLTKVSLGFGQLHFHQAQLEKPVSTLFPGLVRSETYLLYSLVALGSRNNSSGRISDCTDLNSKETAPETFDSQSTSIHGKSSRTILPLIRTWTRAFI